MKMKVIHKDGTMYYGDDEFAPRLKFHSDMGYPEAVDDLGGTDFGFRSCENCWVFSDGTSDSSEVAEWDSRPQ